MPNYSPGGSAKNLMRSSLDFNKKFYNSLGRAPNRRSSSIGKTQGLLLFTQGIGATPRKIARKFKQASPSKKDLNLNLVLVDEEPKSAKKKEKVDVARGKGIELLSEVALTEDAQYEEVRKKSLSAAKIKPSITNKGIGVKPGVPDVIEEESSESEAESWGNDEDDNNNDNNSESDGSDEENNKVEDDKEKKEDECVRNSSYYSPIDDEDKTNVYDNTEGDEDEEMDYTTNQLYDDVDIQLNKPVQADDETVQKEGTHAKLTNIQQGNENLEITPDQIIEDAHVTISIVAKKTEVPVTSSSHSSDLAAKFLKFADIPTTEAEIVSPMDVPVHHEVPSATNPQSAFPDFAFVFQFNNRVSALEKDVSELKKDDPLKTQVTALVDEHLDARLGATRDESMSYLSASK
ncbi:hypothetical protein Tco_1244604 [Tanacetum coccineum]